MQRAEREIQAKLVKLRDLVSKSSFRSSDTPVFPLASGEKSKYYIDCKMAISDPEALRLMADLILDKMGNVEVDAIGGLELGAYPIATAVSAVAYEKHGKTIRAFVVRKNAKKHGLGKVLEGDVRKGDRVLIVDDVITSGKSTIEAIIKSRESGLEVVGAIGLVDRQEQSGKKRIEKEGQVRFDSVLTLEDLKPAGAN